MTTAVKEKDGYVNALPVSTFGTSVPWFRAQFEMAGVPIPNYGPLDLGLRRLELLRDTAMTGIPLSFAAPTNAAYEFFSEAIGTDFLTKTIHRGVLSGLEIGRTQWKQLVSDQPHVASPGKGGDGRNRLWETVLGCSVSTFATDVRFDEPDITCNFAGRPFAVAAKFVHSDRKLWKNVRKGIRQATGRSPAAIVAVNVVDLLPLEDLFRRTLKYPATDPAQLVGWFKDWATSWCETPALKQLVDELRESVPLVIGVAFFMPFLAIWRGNPGPFFYTHMPITWGNDDIDFQFTKAFLRASQRATAFSPQGE